MSTEVTGQDLTDWGEKSIKIIRFSDKKKDYGEWADMLLALASSIGYDEILEGIVAVPADNRASPTKEGRGEVDQAT